MEELLGNPAAERGHQIRFREDRPRGKVGRAEDNTPLWTTRPERAIVYGSLRNPFFVRRSEDVPVVAEMVSAAATMAVATSWLSPRG